MGLSLAVRARQQGFIALFALLSLAVLVGVVTFVLVVGGGRIQRLRRSGGEAQALRAAQEVISRQLIAERLRQPRWWIPPTAGSGALPDGTQVRWWRCALESRWRPAARPWQDMELSRWTQMGASAEATQRWAKWLVDRQVARDPGLGVKGDLITDRAFLIRMFQDLGIESSGLMVDRVWTADTGGSLGRLNLIGADPEVLSRLSGVPRLRIEAAQSALTHGVEDPSAVVQIWSFQEFRALEPWMVIRPFSEARWSVEVRLPTIAEPILMVWRSSFEESPPGNPWFLIRPSSMEQW